MKIELNIEQVIATALAAALDPERLAEKIKVEASKAADAAIQEAVNGYRAEFPKTIKTAIEKMLPHELSLDGQASWNHAITQYINQRLAAMHNQRIEQAIKPVLDELLVTPPAELNVSELVAKLVDFWADDAASEGYDKPTITIDKSSGLTAGYWKLYLDKAENKSKYSCSVSISVTDKGDVYSIKVGDQDMKKIKFAGPFFNFEAYLFQLYAGGTKLILDTEDFYDVHYPSSNDD